PPNALSKISGFGVDVGKNSIDYLVVIQDHAHRPVLLIICYRNRLYPPPMVFVDPLDMFPLSQSTLRNAAEGIWRLGEVL
ncbi:MAG: hypothetical protein K9G33_12995, partial [Sneathiella sp.]|nr:hypothetical protein [Sneathiella sp.]